jgi:hypothetical protein
MRPVSGPRARGAQLVAGLERRERERPPDPQHVEPVWIRREPGELAAHAPLDRLADPLDARDRGAPAHVEVDDDALAALADDRPPYYPPSDPQPADEIDWLRQRVEEVTALCP